MNSQRQGHTSEYLSRRSVLLTVGGAVAVGLAGCSGNGGGTETPTQDDAGGDTETPTPGDGVTTETPTSPGANGDSNGLDISGKVVHNSIDTAEIVTHGAYQAGSTEMNIRVTVQNTGDQPLTPDPVGGAENPLYVRARTLTSEGNQLQIKKIGSGPDEISPGTEATLVSMSPAERSQVARYELCILPQDPRLQSVTTDWEDVCEG